MARSRRAAQVGATVPQESHPVAPAFPDSAPTPLGDDTGVFPRSNRGGQLVLAALALALVLRVVVAVEVGSDYLPKTDSLAFDIHATAIVEGRGMGESIQPPMTGPTAFRAPLYPGVLATVYAVMGPHSYTAALLLNALLGVLVVALVGILGSQLLDRRVGLVAMVLAAVHPGMILTGTSLQLEPLLVCLCLTSLAVALAYQRAPTGRWLPVLAGLLVGLAVLTRELGIFFLPTVAWLAWTAKARAGEASGARTRGRLLAPVLVCATTLAVVAPWTIRNAVRLEAFVPVTTSSGFGLAGTYNETALSNRSEWIPPYNDPELAEVLLGFENPTEVDVDSELRSFVIEFVKDNPDAPLRAAFWNGVRGFDLDGGAYLRSIAPYLPYPDGLLTPSIVAGWLVLALALVGASTRRARSVPMALWAIPLSMLVFMVVFLPFNVRYRGSLEPFLVLLAASALSATAERLGLWSTVEAVLKVQGARARA